MPAVARYILSTIVFLTHHILQKIFSLSDIMDLHHQSSAMCVIMLVGVDTYPWSATKGGNPIPATIPIVELQKITINKLLIPATNSVDR